MPSFATRSMLLGVLVTFGCGSSGGGETSGDGGGGVDATTVGGSARFSATATTWSVPPKGNSSGYDMPSWSINNTAWFTFDLDGDGKPDLVETSDPATGLVWGGDGAGSWKVYLNTGSGFGALTTWPVPSRGHVGGFDMPSSSSTNSAWFTFDLDGDGKPDLMETSDPATGLVWGGDGAGSWKVYLNTGSGFGALTTWPVPSRGHVGGFDMPSSSSTNSAWFTFDLDGDGRPDLMETSDPATGLVWGGDGAGSWKVYLNTGSGFGALTTWPVPSRGHVGGFDMPSSSSTNSAWFTFDLDGDGKPDLMETSDPDTGLVWGGDAAGSWKVYLNTGSGFGALTTWSVPPRGHVGGFDMPSTSANNTNWVTLDLDGDTRPDLVETSDPATGLVWGGDAAASWRMYLNTGSGFGAATTWSVPAKGKTSGYNMTAWSINDTAWSTFDINGDDTPNLVETSDPATGLVWGGDAAASWKVFYGEP